MITVVGKRGVTVDRQTAILMILEHKLLMAFNVQLCELNFEELTNGELLEQMHETRSVWAETIVEVIG